MFLSSTNIMKFTIITASTVAFAGVSAKELL
jgi:hypothetical protein